MSTLKSRKIDNQILNLDGGLFATLPPPPSMATFRDELIDVWEMPTYRPSERAPLPVWPVPAAPRARGRHTVAFGMVAVVALAALGFAARPKADQKVEQAAAALAPVAAETAPATPEAAPLATEATPAALPVVEAPKVEAPAVSVVAVAAPAPMPKRVEVVAVRAPSPPPDDLAVAAPTPLTFRAETLDAAAARIAIASAARGAGACIEGDESTRGMGVSITFAPSGRVTSAKLTSGAFLGTEAGGCIARALRGAHVAAFDGEAVTVNTTIRVH